MQILGGNFAGLRLSRDQNESSLLESICLNVPGRPLPSRQQTSIFSVSCKRVRSHRHNCRRRAGWNLTLIKNQAQTSINNESFQQTLGLAGRKKKNRTPTSISNDGSDRNGGPRSPGEGLWQQLNHWQTKSKLASIFQAATTELQVFEKPTVAPLRSNAWGGSDNSMGERICFCGTAWLWLNEAMREL